MWCKAQRKGRPYMCCPLTNATDLLTVGGSELRSYFSPFVNQSSPDYVSRRGRDRSLQAVFRLAMFVPFRRYSRPKCEVVRNSAKKHVFRPQIFLGGRPQILDQVFKIAPISDHVSKFHGDRPRDRGDLALNKKKARKRGRAQGMAALRASSVAVAT